LRCSVPTGTHCLCTHTHRSNDTVTSPLPAWLADSLFGLGWPGPGWPVLVWLVGWAAGRLTGWLVACLPGWLARWPGQWLGLAWSRLAWSGLAGPGPLAWPGLLRVTAVRGSPVLCNCVFSRFFEEADKNRLRSMMTIYYLTITIALSGGPPAQIGCSKTMTIQTISFSLRSCSRS